MADGTTATVGGITPIYMGSTDTALMLLVSIEDHPHIHGEHSRSCSLIIATMGSPPYTWGAPILDRRTVGTMRITPIYMGSTGFGSKIINDQ